MKVYQITAFNRDLDLEDADEESFLSAAGCLFTNQWAAMKALEEERSDIWEMLVSDEVDIPELNWSDRHSGPNGSWYIEADDAETHYTYRISQVPVK